MAWLLDTNAWIVYLKSAQSPIRPDAPGLGLKFNREAVAKYTHGERLFD